MYLVPQMAFSAPRNIAKAMERSGLGKIFVSHQVLIYIRKKLRQKRKLGPPQDIKSPLAR